MLNRNDRPRKSMLTQLGAIALWVILDFLTPAAKRCTEKRRQFRQKGAIYRLSAESRYVSIHPSTFCGFHSMEDATTRRIWANHHWARC